MLAITRADSYTRLMSELQEGSPFQEELFDGYDYHNPEYYRAYFPLVIGTLPVIEGITRVPAIPFHHWRNDGTFMLDNDRAVVSARIAGVDTDALTDEVLVAAYERLMSEDKIGQASTISWSALQMERPDSDLEVWKERNAKASLAKVNLGLREASALLLASYNDGDEDVTRITEYGVKHFWEAFSILEALIKDGQEGLEPYINYATSLHVALLFSYPALGDYMHRMHKTYASDYDERLAVMYSRFAEKNPDWCEKARPIFEVAITHELGQPSYGRAATLCTAGRFLGVIDADFVKEKFSKQYSQLNLETELEQYIFRMNQIVQSLYTPLPPLACLKGIADNLVFADEELTKDLQAFMATREIEVIQHMLSGPIELHPNFRLLLEEYKAREVVQLPDESESKKDLEEESIRERFTRFENGQEGATPARLDRLIESWMRDVNAKRIDADTFMIYMDTAFEAVLKKLQIINAESYEYLVGYASPICRFGENAINLFLSETIRDKVWETYEVYAAVHPEVNEGFRADFEMFRGNPVAFYDDHWAQVEEYSW